MPKIKLMWSRDAAGYWTKFQRPPVKRPRREGRHIFVAGDETIAGSGDSEPVLVGKSGRMREPYDAAEKVGIYHKLAAVTDDRTAIDFADKFGLLGTGKTQLISQSLDAAAILRELVVAHREKDWTFLSRWLAKHGKAIQFIAANTGAFFVQPKTLKDAIFARFFEDAYSGAQLKMCERPGCGEWFYYGPGSDPPRRSTVRFCSDRCAQAVATARRKGEA